MEKIGLMKPLAILVAILHANFMKECSNAKHKKW